MFGGFVFVFVSASVFETDVDDEDDIFFLKVCKVFNFIKWVFKIYEKDSRNKKKKKCEKSGFFKTLFLQIFEL